MKTSLNNSLSSSNLFQTSSTNTDIDEYSPICDTFIRLKKMWLELWLAIVSMSYNEIQFRLIEQMNNAPRVNNNLQIYMLTKAFKIQRKQIIGNIQNTRDLNELALKFCQELRLCRKISS